MKRIWVLAAVFLAVACTDGSKTGNSGTKTGNSDQIDIELRAVNAPPVASAARGGGATFPVTADAQGSTFEIQMAILSLDNLKLFFDSANCGDFPDVEFDPPLTCSGNHVSIDGPMSVDLIAGESTPSLSDLAIPLTVYEKANMNLANAGVSIYFAGQLTCAGGYTVCTGTHDFSVSLTANSNIPFMGDAFSVDTNTQAIRLNLETDDWFSGLDITQCLEDADLNFEMDDSLVIANGGNPCNNLENAISNAFAASAKFGEVVGGAGFAPESLPEGDHEEDDDE